MFCKPLIVPCIEVISVTAIVCKVGKPLLADIDRFVFKELSIGTACFLNDRTFPFPSVPLSAVRVIPVFRCNMLLYGKAFDTVSEERQKSVLVYCFYQVSFRPDREPHSCHKPQLLFLIISRQAESVKV